MIHQILAHAGRSTAHWIPVSARWRLGPIPNATAASAIGTRPADRTTRRPHRLHRAGVRTRHRPPDLAPARCVTPRPLPDREVLPLLANGRYVSAVDIRTPSCRFIGMAPIPKCPVRCDRQPTRSRVRRRRRGMPPARVATRRAASERWERALPPVVLVIEVLVGLEPSKRPAACAPTTTGRPPRRPSAGSRQDPTNGESAIDRRPATHRLLCG